MVLNIDKLFLDNFTGLKTSSERDGRKSTGSNVVIRDGDFFDLFSKIIWLLSNQIFFNTLVDGQTKLRKC